jgi:hypothetical protein
MNLITTLLSQRQQVDIVGGGMDVQRIQDQPLTKKK